MGEWELKARLKYLQDRQEQQIAVQIGIAVQ